MWAGRDSNPRSRKATDLQSARFDRLPTYPICYGKRIRTSVAALNGRHTNLYMIP